MKQSAAATGAMATSDDQPVFGNGFRCRICTECLCLIHPNTLVWYDVQEFGTTICEVLQENTKACPVDMLEWSWMSIHSIHDPILEHAWRRKHLEWPALLLEISSNCPHPKKKAPLQARQKQYNYMLLSDVNFLLPSPNPQLERIKYIEPTM